MFQICFYLQSKVLFDLYKQHIYVVLGQKLLPLGYGFASIDIIIAGVVTGLIGLVVGSIALGRLKGDYLAIVTLGIGLVFVNIAKNFTVNGKAIFGGSDGIGISTMIGDTPLLNAIFFIITMLFSSGIVPIYLLMSSMKLVENIWGIIIISLSNVFNMLLFKTTFEGIPKELEESALIDGANGLQLFFKIILPQVIKIILPSITNEVITLVKDTSLAFVIAVSEMFTIAKQIVAAQGTVVPLIVAGLFYYIFNYVVAYAMERVEKKFSYFR